MENSRPNILLLHTDQQRFNTIAALGASHVITPNLDRLGQARYDVHTCLQFQSFLHASPARPADRDKCPSPRLLSEPGRADPGLWFGNTTPAVDGKRLPDYRRGQDALSSGKRASRF